MANLHLMLEIRNQRYIAPNCLPASPMARMKFSSGVGSLTYRVQAAFSDRQAVYDKATAGLRIAKNGKKAWRFRIWKEPSNWIQISSG